MKKVLLPLFFILFIQCFRAQESAPSLSLGLDDVLFGKGVIDVDLLTDIISEKQNELKKRIVEKEILKPVYLHSSFATSNYAFSVVKELMNEKDKNVLKKEIMEHTVNYAVVSAFAEMYVQLNWDRLKDTTNSFFTSLKLPKDSLYKFLNTEKLSYSNNDFLKSKLFLTADLEVFKVQDSNKDTLKIEFNKLLMDAVFHSITNNKVFLEKGFFSKPLYFNHDIYLEKSFYLNNDDLFAEAMYQEVDSFVNDVSELYEAFNEVHKYYKSSSDSSGKSFSLKTFADELEKKIEKGNYEMFENSKISLNNQIKGWNRLIGYAEFSLKDDSLKLEEVKGLFNDYIKSEYKDSLNKVLKNPTNIKLNLDSLFVYDKIDQKKFGDSITDTFGITEEHFLKWMENLKPITEYSQLISSIENTNNKMNFWTKERNKANDELKNVEKFKEMNPDEILKNVFLIPLKTELNDLADTTKDNNIDIIMLELYQHYYFIESSPAASANLDYIYKVRQELLPKLGYANLQMQGKITKVIEIFERLLVHIENRVYSPILAKIGKDKFKELSSTFQRIFDDSNTLQLSYLKFFEKLDQLDKMETYYNLLHDVLQVGELSNNRDIANAMNLILKNIEKYTEFDTDKDRIDIDVESVIEALFIKYGSRDKNPFNFYFTLGLNTSLALGADSTHVNFNSASEKIGLKFNLYNAKLRNSYAYGESKVRKDKINSKKELNYRSEDPIVSDFHLLVYGSGLLYQVANLTTSENVNSTFVGGGLGMTFYNGLSFNATLMYPIYEKESFAFKDPYINIGFDIHFVEYITALNKKRKENKKQEDKMEAEIQLKKLEIEKLKIEKEIKKY